MVELLIGRAELEVGRANSRDLGVDLRVGS
jgi:hypothetical protein